MAFAKFQGNRFRINGEIPENHAILVNLTASIVPPGEYDGRPGQPASMPRARLAIANKFTKKTKSEKENK